MATLFLVRHGLTAMTGPVLAGRTPGVHLDERGMQQAAALAERFAPIRLAAVVSSPLERCVETASAIAAVLQPAPSVETDDRLIECGYGDWTGRQIKDLMKDPLWKLVQTQPSAVRFPGGESLAEMATRAVAAVRSRDALLGDDANWLACTHGDIIKAILADALGIHLDHFQRIVPDPASVSVIRYTSTRPYVLRINDSSTGLAAFAAPTSTRRTNKRPDATVGGGAGAGSI